ncbi:MAG: SurA N-terminal domain-containing protein [Methylococcales bacterium]|nr:SurA N-terminal domain-containing protein [Methylococcales bacterium]
MLLKIREKSQGVFAWIILIVICVPFALWGIQNYIGGASEDAIVTVGGTEFYQQDINKAYQQYSQKFAGMTVNETTLRQQALLKLVKDEVLLQHVREEALVIPDETAKKFIQSLEYFQVDGKFDKAQYKALLSSQQLSSTQFIQRIKKAQVMEQYQRSVLASSFATQYDIELFFKIQNQQRDIDYLSIPLTPITVAPTDEAINSYYQKNQAAYQTAEQMSIEYVSLSLDDLAQKVEVTDDQLLSFYTDQKDLYTTKERRKISHILFSFGKDGNDEAVLAKAQAAQKELATKSFEALAAEVSDDTTTAKKGGDLGLFEIGGLEKVLEEAVSPLKLGEVTAPVKSSFGYHLLKVVELVPAKTKPFEAVKAEVSKALQRKEAENSFYEMAERLANISYENADNLTAAADAIDAKVETSALFSKDKGEGVANNAAVRTAAFSEDVLAGNNSESIEMGTDRVIVLRMAQHQPKSVRPLIAVKAEIITVLLRQQAQQQAEKTANDLKKQLVAGVDMQTLATEKTLELKHNPTLVRNNKELPWQVSQAIFKASKPLTDKPTLLTVGLETGEQYVMRINKVTEGVMSESDKKQLKLAQLNIGKALGEATFEAVLNSLQANTEVTMKKIATE